MTSSLDITYCSRCHRPYSEHMYVKGYHICADGGRSDGSKK